MAQRNSSTEAFSIHASCGVRGIRENSNEVALLSGPYDDWPFVVSRTNFYVDPLSGFEDLRA